MCKRKEFTSKLDNLFGIAHADTLKLIKVEDNIFLQRQKEPGQPGCLLGRDKKKTQEKRSGGDKKLWKKIIDD